MTFSARLLLAMIAILVVTVVGTMVAADRWIRASLESTLAEEMAREARLLAEALPHDPAALSQAAHRLGSLAERRLTIIDSTGRVLGDSDFDDASLARSRCMCMSTVRVWMSGWASHTVCSNCARVWTRPRRSASVTSSLYSVAVRSTSWPLTNT